MENNIYFRVTITGQPPRYFKSDLEARYYAWSVYMSMGPDPDAIPGSWEAISNQMDWGEFGNVEMFKFNDDL